MSPELYGHDACHLNWWAEQKDAGTPRKAEVMVLHPVDVGRDGRRFLPGGTKRLGPTGLVTGVVQAYLRDMQLQSRKALSPPGRKWKEEVLKASVYKPGKI